MIVERDVDPGQTVASSLSAPQLFLLANDLSDMQILASVDESDIGQIKEGQPVQFTVQSYPGQQFTGTVKQVRLQSTTTDNVVNYTVVIGVSNSTGKLLPGMTATVQFVTATADSVFTVPSTALRVKPTPDMLASAGPTATDSTAHADSTRGTSTTPGTASAATHKFTGQHASGQRPTVATIWTVDDKDVAHSMRVKVGLTDGQRTQITGRDVKEGMQVITSVGGQASSATTTTTASSNPFQPSGPGGRRVGM